MENLQAIAVIIGLVNGFRLFQQADKTGFYLFCGAIVLGVGFGLLNLFGLDLQSGIIAALASSGLYQVASKVGGK